jgi:DNA-binding LacI/PurR family transcriptional regulator
MPVWETLAVTSDLTSATASAVPRSRAAGAVKVVTGAVVRSAGICVPVDASIVGFDDIPFALPLSPRLTTVRQPAYDMGHRAATLLLDLLDGKADAQPTGLFPVTLNVRDSVAPPKAARR